MRRGPCPDFPPGRSRAIRQRINPKDFSGRWMRVREQVPSKSTDAGPSGPASGMSVAGVTLDQAPAQGQALPTWRPMVMEVLSGRELFSIVLDGGRRRIARRWLLGPFSKGRTRNAVHCRQGTHRKMAAHESPSDVSLAKNPRPRLDRRQRLERHGNGFGMVRSVRRLWMGSRCCAWGTWPPARNDGPIHGRLTGGNSAVRAKGAIRPVRHLGFRAATGEGPAPPNVHMPNS